MACCCPKMNSAYQLVRLNNGICSVRSLADGETFHPVIGPVAEAEALYVRQLVLRAANDPPCSLRLVSFDHTLAPLQFALQHAAELGYFDGYKLHLEELLRGHRVEFFDGAQAVN